MRAEALCLHLLLLLSSFSSYCFILAMKKSIQDTAVSLYRELQRAMVARDTTSLSRILTDGFTLVHMTGYNQPKEEWLTHIQTGRMQYFGSVEHDIHVEVRSDNKVFVIGKSQVDANIWGARGTWPLKLKLHFIRQEEELKISFIEASTY